MLGAPLWSALKADTAVIKFRFFVLACMMKDAIAVRGVRRLELISRR